MKLLRGALLEGIVAGDCGNGNARCTTAYKRVAPLGWIEGMAVDTTIKVMLPALGESVSEGTVLEWHKREGEAVQADDPLVDISTDKVDAEVSAPTAGTVAKIHFEEGDTVGVGAVLAEIAAGPSPPTDGDGANGGVVTPSGPISPVARRVAAVEGVDVSGVQGSGHAGRVTKSDVLAAKAAPAPATPPARVAPAPAPASAAPAPGATPLKGAAAIGRAFASQAEISLSQARFRSSRSSAEARFRTSLIGRFCV